MWTKVAGFVFLLSTLHSPFSILLAEEGKFVYNSHQKRDPFYPIISEEGEFLISPKGSGRLVEGGSLLALEGIVWDEKGGSVAIINGEVVEVGERIGDYEVVRIQKEGVLLLGEQGDIYLSLPIPEGEQ